MLLNALKIAWKVLLRHPFYTFITLFGISLTLTVLMVLTSFLDHLVGSHYPENKRDRLLFVSLMNRRDTLNQSRNRGPISYQFLNKYVRPLQTPEKVGLATAVAFDNANAYVNGKRLSVSTKFTDAAFWEVTDFEFLEGKPYSVQNVSNADPVVVITDELKRNYFEDETAAAVGKTIEIDNARYRVIGVVRGAPITRLWTYADAFFPYTNPKSNYRATGFGGNFIALILAKNRADLPTIQAEFVGVIQRIPMPQEDNGFKFSILEVEAHTFLQDLLNIFFDNDAATTIFYSVVGLFMVLFMSLPAINLINLTVSRIVERASEIGIRKAFGAPTRTLVWQFVVENLFVTFIGGTIALILTLVILGVINRSGWIPKVDLTVNFSVFALSVLVCFVFGLLSGVVPALRMARLSIAEALKTNG